MKALLIFLLIVAVLLVAKHFQLLATIPVVGSLCLVAVIFAIIIVVKILSR